MSPQATLVRSRKAPRTAEHRTTPSELVPFARPLHLTCGACGKAGAYRVGSVMIGTQWVQTDTPLAPDEYVGFTRYFLCRHCGAGGPWELAAKSLIELTAAVMLLVDGHPDNGVYLGESATFDGRRFRYPTEAAAHLRDLIDREPPRAFLWVRLGNIYHHGQRNDLAEEALRQAIELEPENAEAHGCLADVLRQTDRVCEAVPHWKAVLHFARRATDLPRETRQDMVSVALDELLGTLENPNEVFELLPQLDFQATDRPPTEPCVLRLRSYNLSNGKDWEEACELFLGEPVRLPHGEPPLRLVRAQPEEPAPSAPAVCLGTTRTARNAPCPCGSGRKHKKCCGAG